MNNDPIISLCFALFVAFISYKGFHNKSFENQYIFDCFSVLSKKEYFRLLTSGFLHSGWPHLLFNLYSFYVFAASIELYISPILPIVILLVGIIGGNLLSLYVHRHHEYRAYGASGGVCAVIYASIFLFPGGSLFLIFIPIAIPSFLYAILYLVYSGYASIKKNDNIGHVAHLGGAISGTLFVLLFFPDKALASPGLFAVIVAFTSLYFYIILNNYQVRILNFSMPKYRSERDENCYLDPDVIKHDDAELEALLDMVKIVGYDNLPENDQKKLDHLSKKLKKRQELIQKGKDEYRRHRG